MENNRRIRLQKKQTIARQNFALFMDNLPGPAWMKDVQGRYVYVNRRVEQELHPFRGDWFEKTDAELWPSEIAAEYSANDRTVIDTRRTLQTIERYIREGIQGYVLVTKFPIFDKAGDVFMIGATSVDVTELKRVEDLLADRVRQRDAIVDLGHYRNPGRPVS